MALVPRYNSAIGDPVRALIASATRQVASRAGRAVGRWASDRLTAAGSRAYRATVSRLQRGARRYAELTTRRVRSFPSRSVANRMRRSVSRGRRSFRQRRRSRGRSRSLSSRINTRYQPVQGRFFSRRRGRGRARRSNGFRHRVLSSLLSLDPVQVYTLKNSSNQTSGVNTMSVFGVGLYGCQQTDQPDLYNIFTDAGFGLGTATNQTAKMLIKSAILDVEITNTGSNNILLDIYEVYQRQDPDATSNTGSQFQTMFGDLTTITAAAYNDVSNSLFENSVFCEYYKILSKNEIIIAAGDVVSRQMKLTRPQVVEGEVVANTQGFYPRKNRLFIFSWHGAPHPTEGPSTTPAIGSTTITISWQKVYHYQMVPSAVQLAKIHNA